MTLFEGQAELMRTLLHREGTRIRERNGWQPISCVNKKAHSHGDKNPSASVNLTAGKYHCMACGLKGDAFDLGKELYGVDAKGLRVLLGSPASTTAAAVSEWVY